MPTAKKVESVAEMKKMFEDSSSYFITDYQGLNVADITTLRKTLRKSRVNFLVAKNTLFLRAASEAGEPNLEKFFKGPTAIAFSSDDASIAAKILNDFAKDKELPRMKVFVVDDHVHSAADIKRLADLPSREVLLAGVLGAVEAPFSQLVGSIDGFFRELIGSIDALAEKQKGQA
ncbi:MAG: 50S ribosomal protein L10 [candidate division Zixibacteria bacterium]|nr:50S ribosomal protein L10 [candidate division Zixibacteria bacterium]